MALVNIVKILDIFDKVVKFQIMTYAIHMLLSCLTVGIGYKLAYKHVEEDGANTWIQHEFERNSVQQFTQSFHFLTLPFLTFLLPAH